MKESVLDLVRLADRLGASDLHLPVGFPPLVRIKGSLKRLGEREALTSEEVSQALAELTTPKQRKDFQSTLEIDFGYTLSEMGRLRCSAAWQREGISLSIRLLPFYIRTTDELDLPQIYR